MRDTPESVIARCRRGLSAYLEEDRRQAIDELAALPEAAGRELLLSALASPLADVRTAAAAALSTKGDTRWKRRVRGNDWDIRRLGRSREHDALAPLLGYLEWAVSNNQAPIAMLALADLGDRRAVPAIVQQIPLLKGQERQVAAQALARLGQPQWETCLHGDDMDFMRLGLIIDPEVGEILLETLRRGHPHERALAAEGLGGMRHEGALDALVAALQDPVDRVRHAASLAICRARPRAATEALLPLLEHPVAVTRAVAAQTLGLLGDDRARPGLTAACGDDSGPVRHAATTALAWLDGGDGEGQVSR